MKYRESTILSPELTAQATLDQISSAFRNPAHVASPELLHELAAVGG
jgi:hypothetical protein